MAEIYDRDPEKRVHVHIYRRYYCAAAREKQVKNIASYLRRVRNVNLCQLLTISGNFAIVLPHPRAMLDGNPEREARIKS